MSERSTTMRDYRQRLSGLLLMLSAASLVHAQGDPFQNIPNAATQPGVLLPPGTPPGAFNSLAYAQRIRNAPCPGLEDKSSNYLSF
jgi:hypothetical protein